MVVTCLYSLLIGLIVGGLAKISNTETNIRAWFNFYEEIFFLFLLPPIIFQSDFSLAPKPLFSNFGAIVTFAIPGTFISSIVTGLLVHLGGLMFLMFRLPFVECLMFGVLISATDPVSVWSIFQELGTDTNLYALVFEESVLNDVIIDICLFNVIRCWIGFMSALLFKYAGLDIDKSSEPGVLFLFCSVPMLHASKRSDYVWQLSLHSIKLIE